MQTLPEAQNLFVNCYNTGISGDSEVANAISLPRHGPLSGTACFWAEFHSRLIVAIANTLSPYLRPNYYVSVETRTSLDEPE